jgi:hypothetical protein
MPKDIAPAPAALIADQATTVVPMALVRFQRSAR